MRRVVSRACAPASLALCVLLAACTETEPLTQLVIVVDSDWEAIDRFELEVGGFADEPQYDVSVREEGFPRTLTLVHDGGSLGPIDVTVRAYQRGSDEAVLVEPRTGIHFVKDRTLLLRIDLLAACRGRCMGMACVASDDGGVVCASSRDAAELVEWTGSIDPLGTSVVAPEADGGADGGGPLDAGEDAAVTSDGGTDAGGAMTDAGDADVGVDAGLDAGVDAGADAGVDAGPCTVSCMFATDTPNADGTIECVGDQCLITCDLGFLNCDGDYANGCETSVGASCGCPALPARRKLLTLDGARVGGTLTDFPLLVATTDAELAAGAATDGADICFTADDGVTPLPFELERYAGATGLLLAWVAVPTLSNGVDTTLYLYYGDGTTASRATPAAVWDADYAAVYHFDADAHDSTANGNAGLATGATAGGNERLGGVASFVNAADAIDCGSDASIDNVFSGGGTLEVWFRPNTFGGADVGRVVDKATSNATAGGWALMVNAGGQTEVVHFVQGYLAGNGAWATASNSIPLSVWSHVALTYDRSSLVGSAPTLYLNGVQASLNNTSTGTFGTSSDASASLRVGNSAAGDRAFDGVIDEVRLSTTERSAGWLTTGYANQSDPGGFVTVGAEETYP